MTNQRSTLITMTTNNHFQKVHVMGIVQVYHPCEMAFGKVLKFDVEFWAVDHCTPFPLKLAA